MQALAAARPLALHLSPAVTHPRLIAQQYLDTKPPTPETRCAGMSDFSARARAANFPPEELPSVMTYLHQVGQPCRGNGCW